MRKSATWLLDHRQNTYSQNGEDGVIARVLDVIGESDSWCVDVGAGDGIYLSNTRLLVESRGYSAVLIEGDRKRYHALKRNCELLKQVVAVRTLVDSSSEHGLDAVLDAFPIPSNFDMLSIDIDGNDYHVWKSITRYQPKIVVIEFNSTIPTRVPFVQTADSRASIGSSLLSLVVLGKDKGYELVAVLATNAVFVCREYYPRFELESNAPEVLRVDESDVTYLFSGYDGTVFLQGACRLPWHDIAMNSARLQLLPKLLRMFPANYSIPQKILWVMFLRPRVILRRLRLFLMRHRRARAGAP